MSSGSRRILIVEDEPLIGWSMARALGSAGYEPEVIGCGEEAVRRVGGSDYVLVISDYRLPGMCGLDLAPRLKAAAAAIPVVILSTHEDFAQEDDGPAPGVDYVLEKPFRLGDLVGLVGGILAATAPASPGVHPNGAQGGDPAPGRNPAPDRHSDPHRDSKLRTTGGSEN